MIRIIRKTSLVTPIVVLLALLILIGPLPKQEAKADGGLTIVLAGIAAGAVGAAVQGTWYWVNHRVFGDDWNCADQYTNITLGFAEGVTFLWAALYAPAAFSAGILEITGKLATFETAHQIIADWLGDKLEAHFDFTCTPEEFEYAVIRSTLLAATPSLTLLLSPLVDAMTAAEGEEPDTPTFGPLFADFTNNTIDTSGMSITTYGMEHNTSEGASWRMLNPGTSYLEATFDLAEIPDGVILSLTHLSSASADAPGGGYSPVDIYINGSLFRDNHDVAENHCGSHGYAIDKWQIQNYLVSGENTITIAFEDDPWAYTHYWIQALAISPGIAPTNMPPRLSHPRVDPLTGDESTQFEFSVDYYDADGQAPHPDGRKVYFSDGRQGTMTLKSGLPCDGTYHYTTTFPTGSYSYWFLFPDTEGGVAKTEWQNGPYVWTTDSSVELLVDVSEGPVTDNIEIKFCYGPDLGDWDECQEWSATQMPQPWIVGIDSGKQLMFSVSTESVNHSFTKWVFLDDEGNIVRESTASGYGFTLLSGNLHATAYLTYTPINYTISGTVLGKDGTPVPGGIELLLTSSQQTMTRTSNDGNFSFTGVNGGVPVTITPSADGYAFSPSGLSFSNLKDDHTGNTIVAYSSDNSVPMTDFVTFPSAVSEESSVTFSWIGQDDTTDAASLLYQYKLDGVDTDWSVWNSSTTQSYDLGNGAYTFWVQAKDEAENINQAPANYTFVVNAAPRITSSARINHSVWASRITLEMPIGATRPSNTFILLSDHSGIADLELVPVAIHKVDEIAPVGANEIVANELGLALRIVEAEKGWMVTLPDDIPSGQTAQYDVVWGKISYFGWQEYVTVSQDFPNLGAYGSYLNCHIEDSFLDENHSIWRLASKIYQPGFHWDGQFAWTMMNASSHNGTVIPEKTIRFLPGIPWDGSYAEIYETNSGEILKAEQNVCYLWEEEKYVKEDVDGDSEFYRYHGYVIRSYDSMGNLTGSFDSEFLVDTWYDFAKEPIGNYLWIVGDSWNASSTDLWFTAHDSQGNRIIPMTTFESASTGYSLDSYKIRSIADNVIFLFEQSWNTPENDDRRRIYYQIRDINGNLIKDTTELNPPLLPDSVEQDDEYDFESTLTDNDGKVWICFEHTHPGSDEYYYSVIGEDGNISKGPILLSAERQFRFCDKDGYIWATENGQFFALNPDDTIAVAPRTPAWIPSQRVGQIIADVTSEGYRLYDRWSPQLIAIDVPSGVNADSMVLFDLNVWDNDLHPANLSLKKGETSVWSQSGQFTSYTTVDISGTLSEGANILTMTQDDFLGGQVLVTFPYDVTNTHSISGQVSLNGGTASVTDVLLTLSGAAGQTTYPDTSGNYSFTELEEGNYTVTPYLTDYHFFPASLSYSSLDSDESNQDFTGHESEQDIDVDGNGTTDALTDGLLIIRYLFGFRGDDLTDGAVAPDCSCCRADEIEPIIQSLMP